MRTLFISDCHLTPNNPAILTGFRKFLKDQVASADAMYILGDLFEYWIGSDILEAPIQQVMDDLYKTTRHTPIYFLHGNRDFLIDGDFEHKTGCQILKQPTVIELNGTATLIMHGDELCSDDHIHQIYRRIVRTPLVKTIFNSFSHRWRQRIARSIRRKSEKSMAHKSPEIMDVNQNTVVAYMQRFAVTQMIHGHTHRPAIHTVSLPHAAGRRIVLGDWNQYADILIAEDDKLNLHSVKVVN